MLLQSSRESQCPCMHSLRDHLCLTVGTKGTVCKLILWPFLEFVESVNCPYFIQHFMQLLALLWICRWYMKNNPTYSTIISMSIQLNRSSRNVCLRTFFSGYTHQLCREYNCCVNYTLHALSGGGNVQQLYT